MRQLQSVGGSCLGCHCSCCVNNFASGSSSIFNAVCCQLMFICPGMNGCKLRRKYMHLRPKSPCTCDCNLARPGIAMERYTEHRIGYECNPLYLRAHGYLVPPEGQNPTVVGPPSLRCVGSDAEGSSLNSSRTVRLGREAKLRVCFRTSPCHMRHLLVHPCLCCLRWAS